MVTYRLTIRPGKPEPVQYSDAGGRGTASSLTGKATKECGDIIKGSVGFDDTTKRFVILNENGGLVWITPPMTELDNIRQLASVGIAA